MKVLESQLKSHIVKTCALPSGDLHLFDNIAIIEFKEGAIINIENTSGILNLIIKHFGVVKPFGLISNRIHSYALQPLDLGRVKEHITNLAAYGVVAINKAGRMGAEIENSFCEAHDILYTNLYEAADAVYKRVQDKQDLEVN